MALMIELNFENKYNHKINFIGKKKYIFDPLRKKNILLTNEEWVRQNIILFLKNELKVPLSHIAVERGFTINNLKKRFDIVVYNKKGEVQILIECKAPNIKIKQSVFNQISKYNLVLNSKFLMITNGINHLFLKNLNEKVDVINHLPVYLDL